MDGARRPPGALELARLAPLELDGRDALALVNGTSVTPASLRSVPTNMHNQDVVPFGTQAAFNALELGESLTALRGSLAALSTESAESWQIPSATPLPCTRLTGPEALDWYQVADLCAKYFGHPVRYRPVAEPEYRGVCRAAGVLEDTTEFLVQLFAAVRAGFAEPVTQDVEQLTGRRPAACDASSTRPRPSGVSAEHPTASTTTRTMCIVITLLREIRETA